MGILQVIPLTPGMRLPVLDSIALSISNLAQNDRLTGCGKAFAFPITVVEWILRYTLACDEQTRDFSPVYTVPVLRAG